LALITALRLRTLQLRQWLDLSLNNSIPPSLLLLSRTLYLPTSADLPAQIAATISSLPESAAARTSAQIGEREGKIRNVMRLELIKDEQRKIEEEEQEQKELEEKEREKERQEAERALDDVLAKEQAEQAAVHTAVLRMDVPKLKTLVTAARDQVKARAEGKDASPDADEISPADLDYIK